MKLSLSIVKTLLLAIPAYGLALVPIAVGAWFFFFVWLFLVFSGDFEAIPVIGLPLAALIIGFIWYSFIKIIYSLLLRVFWSDPPEIVRPGGIREGLITYGEIIVVTLPSAVLFSILIGAFGALIDANSAGRLAGDLIISLDTLLLRWGWLWLLSGILYYRFVRR